jgi:hypothetical protein
MTARLRSFWLPAAVVAYVGFAAVEARPGSIVPWIALLVLPVVVAEVFRRSAVPPGGQDHTDPVARSAVRAGFWGAALWLAARAGPAGRPAFDAAANLGAGAASIAGLVALARISAPGGLITAHAATRSLDAATFAGLLWGIAVAVPGTRALLTPHRVRLDPLAIDYATTTAGIGSLLVLVAATWRLRALRRLEIGVGDRAAGALALALTAFLVAVPAAALDVAPPDRVLPVAVISASLLCIWAATTPEPTSVSSLLRGILAVMLLGAPITLGAGLLARELPARAGAVVLVACCMCVAIGLIARAVARPLGPEQSRWLDAIDAASRAALQPEPDAAIRAALVSLGGTSRAPGSRPELWRNDPKEVLSADIAGYLHVQKAEAPERIYELALAEPERTLRAETLRALEVRRPDVRPLLAWFESRRAFSATLVLDEEGPLGFILMPHGNRSAPMTLEEARAVRLLADRISALLAVSSALARSRERELAAIARADQLDDERQRLEHIILRESGRHEQAAERAARRLRSSCYSPAARLASEQLERLGRLNVPVALLTPPGVDALGWIALAHLASPRNSGPLLVVDSTSGAEHDADRWQDPDRSPLKLADGGTLAILDLPALPISLQDHISRTFSRLTSTPARSSILSAGLIATLNAAPAELVTQGRLSQNLMRWFGDNAIAIPPLRERPEDLRALMLDGLARAGLSTKGVPIGVDPGALRLLMEHAWPGNDAELAGVLLRVAQVARGPAVTPADLTAIGFSPELSNTGKATTTPLPTPLRRRATARSARRY